MITKEKYNFKLPYLYLVVVFFLTMWGARFLIPGSLPASEILGVLLSFTVCGAFLLTKQFFLLVFYSIVVFFNYYTGDAYLSDGRLLLDNVVSMLVSLSLSFYVFRKHDDRLMQLIIYLVYFITIWTAIATFVIDLTYPEIVREIAYIMNGKIVDDWTGYIAFFKMGLSDYYSPHAIPILIPPLVLGIKNDELRKYRFQLYFVLIACFFIMFLSGATGPLLIGIMVLVMSFVVSEGSNRNNIIRTTIAFLLFSPFIYSDVFFLGLLSWIDGLIGNGSIFHDKIDDFQRLLISGNFSGDIEMRNDLYSETIDGIKENILIGSDKAFGGHSALLDRFSSMGLVGIVPLFLIFFFQAKFVLRFISRKARIYYYLGIIAAILELTIKGVTCWSIWFYFFAVLPISVYLFEKKRQIIRKS